MWVGHECVNPSQLLIAKPAPANIRSDWIFENAGLCGRLLCKVEAMEHEAASGIRSEIE